AVAVAVAGEKRDLLVADAPEAERGGRVSVGRMHGLAPDVRESLELGQAGAADHRQHQVPFIARISGRLRQNPFASMPQPNTKRSGIVSPTKSALMGFFLSKCFSTSTAQAKLFAPSAVSRSRIAAMVWPPSRMSSSTSTARPFTLSAGST